MKVRKDREENRRKRSLIGQKYRQGCRERRNNYLKVTPEILLMKSERRGDELQILRANWTAHMSSK